MFARFSHTHAPKSLEPLSTRLFPKGLGAEAYQLSGIAKRCDWVVLSDRMERQTCLRKNRSVLAPRHIFLSLRHASEAFRFFADTVLPQLRRPFILVSGSEDVTLPRQLDQRFAPFPEDVRCIIDTIRTHPGLRRWYVENLDADLGAKVSPLPLGKVFAEGRTNRGRVSVPEVRPFSTRRLRVFVGHRVRGGPQWEPRRQVTGFAENCWRDFATLASDELSEQEYFRCLERHPFVACVNGGGLDPSPKAWDALLHGAIPIIEESAVSRGYLHLPCIVVPSWAEDTLSITKLERWRAEWAPKMDAEGARSALIVKLGFEFWWKKIRKAEPL